MISGAPVNKENFIFEDKTSILIDDILAIKEGVKVGSMIKGLNFLFARMIIFVCLLIVILGFVSSEECERLSKAFFTSPFLYYREGMDNQILHMHTLSPLIKHDQCLSVGNVCRSR